MTTIAPTPLIRKAALLMAALLLHATGHAELYKWVDAQGKTHYSNRNDAPANARVGALKHDAAPAPAAATSWQERERQFQLRQARSSEAITPPGRPRRLATSHGSNQTESDKSRCELARDVLSGAVRHGNGAVTDANDRQIAQRDVAQFCR
ncbi:MAG: DUF4124 domain-containing protein [Telluria sp.]